MTEAERPRRPSARRAQKPSAPASGEPQPKKKTRSAGSPLALAGGGEGEGTAKTENVRPSARRGRKKVEIAPEPVAAPSEPPASKPDALFEMQDELDRLLREADNIAGDPVARRRAAEALTAIAARLASGDGTVAPPEEGLLGGARELLSTDYYFRQWGRLGLRNRSEEVDDFGLDRTYESRMTPLFETLYRRYFRVSLRGVEKVPDEGRAMIVANHGGALPWDGLMLRTALRLEHPKRREARWLAEDFVYHMPFLGAFVARVGAVRACPENAERLLAQNELLTVFPEGIKGVGKLFKDRYALQRFGRGGYVKLALRSGAPIVPAGIVGAEEAYPMLMRSSRLASLVGLPFLPITPTFPWLGPLGLVPLPSRWAIVIGDPIDFGAHDPERANDAVLVNRLNEQVRARVQELVAQALELRGASF